MPYKIAHYGWIPDLPDQRDFQYAAPPKVIGALPASADLTSACPPVYDQSQLGSCTANAIAAALEFDQMKQHLPAVFVPSRLFIYYNERVIEGTVNSDSGAQLRDGMKSAGTQGVCPEDMWPYNIANFQEQPTNDCYQSVAKTGNAPMPQPGEKTLGGHAVLAVGYDDANQWFIARNSWGTGWGMQGYFTLPYAYLTSRSLSSDFWTVRVVQ